MIDFWIITSHSCCFLHLSVVPKYAVKDRKPKKKKRLVREAKPVRTVVDSI